MSTDKTKLPPSLEKIRDEAAEAYKKQGLKNSWRINYCVGFNALYYHLLNSGAQFDEKAAKEYSSAKFPCELPCDSYGICSGCVEAACFRTGARYQHNQSSATIAALRMEIERLEYENEFNKTTYYELRFHFDEKLKTNEKLNLKLAERDAEIEQLKKELGK